MGFSSTDARTSTPDNSSKFPLTMPLRTRRKISGGTRSETGRDCRDAFLGLMKTCDKLGVSFWDYLGSRLDIPGAPPILPLPDLIRQRAAA